LLTAKVSMPHSPLVELWFTSAHSRDEYYRANMRVMLGIRFVNTCIAKREVKIQSDSHNNMLINQDIQVQIVCGSLVYMTRYK